MRETELTADEIHERVKWLKSVAKEGADALHSRTTTVEQRHKPTPTEELARARARADRDAARRPIPTVQKRLADFQPQKDQT